VVSRYPVPAEIELGMVFGRAQTGALSRHLLERKLPRSGSVVGVGSVTQQNANFAFRRLSGYPATLYVGSPRTHVWAAWWQDVRVPLLLVLLWLACGFAIYRWVRTRQLAWGEERNRRLAELEAANQSLEAFSYSVAHDLRGPLRSISGGAGMLARNLAGRLDESDSRRVDAIQASIRNMGDIIDDLLRLADVVRAPLHAAVFDLSPIAGELAAALQQGDLERRVSFVIEPGLMASGDPGLVRVALDNLMRNAWKFTARAPEARIDVCRASTPRGTAFCVRDNGVGFDGKFAERLFGVFERLHQAAEFEGRGIGLAIVRRIIDRHGGVIWAEAAPGKGASFFFTLPAAA
jgi:signal transduction histidine kinase